MIDIQDIENFRCPRCGAKIVKCDCPECAKHRVDVPIAVDLSGPNLLAAAPLGNKYIYFLWSDKHIKIGSTAADPRKRAHAVQNECNKKVTLIGALLGSESLELELHEQFNGARIEGEWFYPCRGLLDLLIESFGHF